MRKIFNCVIFCLVASTAFWCSGVIRDSHFLSEELIRMHVVANSDTLEDQSVKLRIRDAVCASIEQDLQSIQDPELAIKYLSDSLPRIKAVADEVLREAGFDMEATVSLCKEYFPTRMYDTFRLPAGIYEALRITIGDGNGKNWWCVAFPTLCSAESYRAFSAAAVSAGFSEQLTSSLASDGEYHVRFYLLDFLGRVAGRIYED